MCSSPAPAIRRRIGWPHGRLRIAGRIAVATALNLEGFVNYVGDGRDNASSYVQLFRNGAIEGVLALGTDERNSRAYIPGPALCKRIVFALRQYVDVLNTYDMGFPVFALLSFTGMDGSTLRYNSGFGNGFSVAGPRPGTIIALPEIALEVPVAKLAARPPRCTESEADPNWRQHDMRT